MIEAIMQMAGVKPEDMQQFLTDVRNIGKLKEVIEQQTVRIASLEKKIDLLIGDANEKS